MAAAQIRLERAALYLTCASAVSNLFSIAASQILLVCALLVIVIARIPIRFPPIKLPLGLFVAGTLASLLASPDPAAGLPQIKKFFVFLALLAVATTVHNVRDVRLLYFTIAGAAGLAAIWGCSQFLWKVHQAGLLHQNFYTFYVGDRIKGFMGHWMTYGGEQMMSLLLLLSLLFFTPPPRKWVFLFWAAAGAILSSILLGGTRIIWAATAVSAVWLIWWWRPKLLLVTPVVLAAALLVAPPFVRERALSIYQPHGTVDSNQHRYITRRTGWEMIKAHPWLGLGPEMMPREFNRYVPADILKPLPSGYYGHLHNIYLQYAAERGIPTMLAMMWLIGKVLYDLFRSLRRGSGTDGTRRGILIGGMAVVIAILIEGMLEHNLGDSEVLMMFLIVVACSYTAVAPREAVLAND
ncbi:MAG TPA: O-antigen ligase family protein [Bryobacteraceae bacterium]|nr:O-antigen ligase family protein [Bryobacteraceae bacterium]